jgi:methylation protein EvaC
MAVSKCLVCSGGIEPFISFGRMPIANGFLTREEFADEFFFELRVGFCPACSMVQLTDLVSEEKLFHDAYPFFSSTSRRMASHFQRFAHWIRERYTGADPLVIEIGCNDGIMLQHFSAAGVRHVGIEPAKGVADVARGKGLNVISEFFDEELARRIVSQHGQADAFLGANVMCHIPYLHSVADGVRLLLKPRGVLAFEDPYLGAIVGKTAYDQIYDEHVFYFSATAVSKLFEQHGLELIDVASQDVHGGSMRYVLSHRGARPVAAAVHRLLMEEKSRGLDQATTFAEFRANVERSKQQLVALLMEMRRTRKRVVGYAATSKSTTVINYCGITPELLEFISDTTPIKQGKFSPGMHIPIRPHSEFVARYPDYALLFGWNHSREIKDNEKGFRAAGGRWIEYVPEVHVAA